MNTLSHRFRRPLRLAGLCAGLLAPTPLAAWAQIAPPNPAYAPAAEAPAAAPAPRAPETTSPSPPARAPRAESNEGDSQLFNLTLILADNSAENAGAGALPRGVEKALTDLKDFLPYKHYRVIDSALIRGITGSTVRLRGPAQAELAVRLDFAPERIDEAPGFLVREFTLVRGAFVSSSSGTPPPREALLEASFRIRSGETVVVGSSRIPGQGEAALIVLLTAVRE